MPGYEPPGEVCSLGVFFVQHIIEGSLDAGVRRRFFATITNKGLLSGRTFDRLRCVDTDGWISLDRTRAEGSGKVPSEFLQLIVEDLADGTVGFEGLIDDLLQFVITAYRDTMLSTIPIFVSECDEDFVIIQIVEMSEKSFFFHGQLGIESAKISLFLAMTASSRCCVLLCLRFLFVRSLKRGVTRRKLPSEYLA